MKTLVGGTSIRGCECSRAGSSVLGWARGAYKMVGQMDDDRLAAAEDAAASRPRSHVGAASQAVEKCHFVSGPPNLKKKDLSISH